MTTEKTDKTKNARASFDGYDRYIGENGVLRDITDCKQAEASLLESNALLSALFESSPTGLVLIEKETRVIVRINSFATRLIGLPPSEITGRVCHDVMCPAERGKCPLADLGQNIDRSERFLVHKDGGRIPILKSVVEIQLTGKDYLFESFVDISERKQAEAERERLIAAIEQGGETVIITDPKGIIQYVNPAFEKVTGYAREEALGQNPRILKSGKQDEAFYREMWSTLTKGDVFRGRMVNKRKDGALYTEDATISPVRDAAGRIVNYVAVKHDVTKHIQLESQLRQAQKMESVGRLAGGVAHDYNNMLTVILGYTELAMDQVAPADPLHADLKEIYKAGKRSMEITGQLLAFARKQIVNPRVIDLNETLEGMLKMLRRLIGEDIAFAWLPEARLWPVKMDPSQIDQILVNLCVNARDAIAGVGKVTIETENITFDAAYCADHAGFTPGEFVMLAVSDDGCGMDRETLNSIFEPFFTTKEMGRGTGLGLATVYGIVKQNNGFINVYSEPGKGSTFRIYLPRHAGDTVEEIAKIVAATAPSRGETVLLVEDEPSIIRMGQIMLEKLGYRVLAAETPGKAMRLASEHAGTIHLLITDVVMPEINGRDLAEKLHALRPDIRVLFMSGYTPNAIAHHGILEADVQFIQKPFSLKDLAAKIRKALD